MSDKYKGFADYVADVKKAKEMPRKAGILAGILHNVKNGRYEVVNKVKK